MTTYDLKIWPEFFEAVVSGRKTFEIRKNDNDFRVDDEILLREWDPSSEEYSRRKVKVGITYILHAGFGLEPGYCALGIRILKGWNRGR